jgi:hypothetical protein
MKNLEKFKEMIKDGDPGESLIIPCRNATDQESTRTSMFYKRGKLPFADAENVGIRKKEIAGDLYVELYYRGNEICYTFKDGVLTPITRESAEKSRMRKLMVEDGCSDEEIADALQRLDEAAK